MSEHTKTRRTTWLSIFISLNGVALAWYEAIGNNFDRPWLLALAGAMIGVVPMQAIDLFVDRKKGE